MFRLLFRHLSPAGARARLPIFIYHRVLAQPDPLFPNEVDAARFDDECSWIANWFNVLPLDDAVARLADGSLPERAAAITFDDGYADNHDVALPILLKHRLCATFFVATGFLDGGRMWNDTLIEAIRRCPFDRLDLRSMADDVALGVHELDGPAGRRQAIDHLIGAVKYLPVERRASLVDAIAARSSAQLPADLMMRSDQVCALHREGMQIGAHTVSHPILRGMDAHTVRQEILESKRRLEHIVGAPVQLFAYPNGKPGVDYDDASVELVRQIGFSAAVSTTWGAARRRHDLFQLPRFTPWDRARWRYGARLVRMLAN